MTSPSATTRLAAVIGDPVRHSLSPALFNAAFAARGMDWAYLAFEVSEPHGADAIGACRALGLEGLSVTMPHKRTAALTVDRCTPQATALQAVNCVQRIGDELVGHNTDGAGFVDALAEDLGEDVVEGARTVVLGAGGAARAIVLALAERGAAEVAVVNRTEARAAEAASLAPGVARIGRRDDLAGATLVVNATSVGMAATGDAAATSRFPVEPELLHDAQVVVDVVYHPLRTALLDAASERGARTVGGLGMLVHQAAHAFRIWTGEPAPLDAMWTAARAGVAERSAT
ncbi:shikimate dehydrogenase [Actinomarinicola tropica]|uniref:shikimate dehydrogenase n=1 Tax=Actinomarinicola tropica TaxID=2789776 RepID=UPI00189C45B2|nr:shikimate dehydrogenase [Actinomarinicola tropica]